MNTIVYTALLNHPYIRKTQPFHGWGDCITSAVQFGNCRVVVATDSTSIKIAGAEIAFIQNLYEEPLAKLLKDTANQSRRDLLALDLPSDIRWLALKRLLDTGTVSLPIVFQDWDVMVFMDFQKACMPFLEYDYSTAWMHHNCNQCPTIINSQEALEELIAAMEAYCHEKNDIPVDMHLWTTLTTSGKYSVGDMARIIDHTVFDNNIGNLEEREVYDFEQVPDFPRMPCKKLTWDDGVPKLHHKQHGAVVANQIHCWLPYKNKTAALLAKANERHN